MDQDTLLLGIDGGGTKCRARLCAASGVVLGEGRAGPANLRHGLRQGFAAALEAARQSFQQAGLSRRDFRRTVAGFAFAGATEPEILAAARGQAHPFGLASVTSDGHAACVGAHGGRDGGVVAIGTGLIAWAVLDGRQHRIGGWGFPVSDEGSGAWLGCEAVRRALWAHDGRISWTPLLREVFDRFDANPHEIVRWMSQASPGDIAAFAPAVVEHAGTGDPAASELMRRAGGHVDAAALRLIELGVPRLSILGGLASSLEPWLARQVRDRLNPASGDTLDGAIWLARANAEAMAAAG